MRIRQDTLVRVPDHPFQFEDAALERRARAVLRRLPALDGQPIRVQNVRGLCDVRGPVHGGAFLRQRRVAFNCSRQEFPRIFVHELAHFVWLRLGNPARRSWEGVLRAEGRAGARGELGWSAEWRKQELSGAQIRARHRRWREYCCESFCDTAAWLYSGIQRHPEFTLAQHFRQCRRAWFRKAVESNRLSI
jgi:hypothetical protein